MRIHSTRLCVEALEDRFLLSGIPVVTPHPVHPVVHHHIAILSSTPPFAVQAFGALDGGLSVRGATGFNAVDHGLAASAFFSHSGSDPGLGLHGFLGSNTSNSGLGFSPF
jgi:hypothetical protein